MFIFLQPPVPDDLLLQKCPRLGGHGDYVNITLITHIIAEPFLKRIWESSINFELMTSGLLING